MLTVRLAGVVPEVGETLNQEAPVLTVTVRIGGRIASVPFAGLAPGFTGVLQINTMIPDDTTPGDNVPLEVTIGSATSQPGVTLAVR